LAVGVEFGAVIGAAQSVADHGSQRQRRQPVRAEIVERDHPARCAAIDREPLAEQRAGDDRALRKLGGFRDYVPGIE
jgi:hypothetical protein